MKTNKRFSVLFVCSGNSCRSPMAEGLLKAKLPPDLREVVTVQSVGTLGIDNNPATNYAIEAAAELGADISFHRSQGITDELVRQADIVLGMSIEHLNYLRRTFPELHDRFFLLRTFDRTGLESSEAGISDPIGGSMEMYRQCAGLISNELDRILPRISKIIKDRTT